MKIRIRITDVQAKKTLRWALFVMSALTMTLKVVEASAHNTYQHIKANPEVAQYSQLATNSLFH